MKKDISTVEEMIEFALEKEAETAGIYRVFAEQVKTGRAKQLFEELSSQETEHYKSLADLDADELGSIKTTGVTDLKISDYLHDVSYSPDMTYQDIMIFAMKSEEHSRNLYRGLAEHSDDGELKKLFDFLTAQEAEHKLKLEREYEDTVMREG